MASHALPRSSFRERRASLWLMVAATVIGLVCAFGPIWMVRAGLFASILGAAFAVWFAFREISRLEVLHRTELKASREAASLAAHAHHIESMDIIDTFTTRYRAHGEQLAALRSDLSVRQLELSTLRGNLVSVRSESDRRGVRISELEEQLAARQADFQALEVAMAELGRTDAQVVKLPRRPAARTILNGGIPTAAELWSDGNHPTIVDLAQLKMPFLEERKQA